MPWPLSCIRANEPLANHTSIRIGGPAEWFAQPGSIEELRVLLREAFDRRLAISILGGGTNTLASDRGIRGLVIHLGPAFQRIEAWREEDRVRARCGAALPSRKLVAQAAKEGWEGFENLAGLPGQIGGAIVMNAQNIGSLVERVSLVDFSGELKTLDRAALHFAYRYSELPEGIIVEAEFGCRAIPVSEAAEAIRAKLDRRNATQDLSFPSAGCAFRNPPHDSAGRLIDAAGLKGARIGDAQVSEKHANFIINVGAARATDVLALIEFVQQRVRQRFGISLEPEVRMIGEAYRHEQIVLA